MRNALQKGALAHGAHPSSAHRALVFSELPGRGRVSSRGQVGCRRRPTDGDRGGVATLAPTTWCVGCERRPSLTGHAEVGLCSVPSIEGVRPRFSPATRTRIASEALASTSPRLRFGLVWAPCCSVSPAGEKCGSGRRQSLNCGGDRLSA